MRHHLEEISRYEAVDPHAVLTLERAGWHTTRKLSCTCRRQPPSLNLTEDIWRYLRQTYLSYRVFRDFDDASSSAWNKLTAEPGSH